MSTACITLGEETCKQLQFVFKALATMSRQANVSLGVSSAFQEHTHRSAIHHNVATQASLSSKQVKGLQLYDIITTNQQHTTVCKHNMTEHPNEESSHSLVVGHRQHNRCLSQPLPPLLTTPTFCEPMLPVAAGSLRMARSLTARDTGAEVKCMLCSNSCDSSTGANIFCPLAYGGDSLLWVDS